MNLSEIVQFILLPAIGWIALQQYKLDQRLTRIETILEILLSDNPKLLRRKNELRPTQLAHQDRP
jgi:hypothetical protein